MGRVVSTVFSVGSLFSKGLFRGQFNWWGLGLLVADQVFGKGTNQQGARLTDLAVQTSEEGQPLPRGWGTWRQAGNLVWATKLQEHPSTTSSGGKGGPKNTSTEYFYSTSLFIEGGLGPITRLNKIYANEKVLYDYNGGSEQGFTLTQDITDGHFYGSGGLAALPTDIRIYIGTANQQVDPDIEAARGTGRATAYANKWGVFAGNFGVTPYGNAIPNFTFEVYYSVVGLPSIITEICGWVGLTSTDLDLTALSGLTVAPYTGDGFVLTGRQTAADALHQLMVAYHFDLPEVDGVLRAVRRGGESIVTFTDRELRVHVAGEAMPETTRTEADPLEVPQNVEWHFFDKERRSHEGMRLATGQATPNERRDSVTTTMQMAGDRAQQQAKIRLAELGIEAEKYAVQMGLAHLWLSAADVGTIPTAAGDRDVRLPELTVPLFGPITCTAPVSDGAIYNAPLGGTAGSLPPGTVGTPLGLSILAFQGNSVVDTLNEKPIIYFAAATPYLEPWQPVTLVCPWFRFYNDARFDGSAAITQRATMGDLTDTLEDYADGSLSWDEDSSITVDLLYGTLASADEDDVNDDGLNYAWVGKDDSWELLQFAVATLVGTVTDGDGFTRRRYTLSSFLRGQRGTESFIGTHGSGEKFILANQAVLAAPYDAVAINRDITIQAFSGATEEDITLTAEGVNLKPYSPYDVEATVDGSGNITLTWRARSRYAAGGAVRPIGEETEVYYVELYADDTFADDELVTYTTYTPSQVISAADQTTYLGGLASAVSVRIYQGSATVGRGYPAEVTVTPD